MSEVIYRPADDEDIDEAVEVFMASFAEMAARTGAKKFFTWSSPDTTAMAAYMRSGMLPGYQILMFAGTPENLGESVRAGSTSRPRRQSRRHTLRPARGPTAHGLLTPPDQRALRPNGTVPPVRPFAFLNSNAQV